MSTAVAVVLFLAVIAYAVFGGADFGAGFWDLVAGRRRAGRAPARGDRPLDRPGVGGQPRLADLHLRRAVDRLPRGLRLDHPHAVRARSTIAALGIVLRGASFAFRKTVFRTRDRRNFGAVVRPLVGARARTAWARSPAASPRAGCPPAARPATPGQLGQPDVDPRRRPGRRRRSPTSPRSTSSGTPAGCDDAAMAEYFRRRAVGAAIVAGVVALVGIFVLRADARYLFDGLDLPGPAARDPLRRRAASASLVLLRARRRTAAPGSWPIGAVAGVVVGWGVAQWPYMLPESLTVVRGRGALGHARGPAGRDRARRGHRRSRASSCSTSSTRRACCPRKERTTPDQPLDRSPVDHIRRPNDP